MANPTYTNIDIGGVSYPDAKAAAAALGVTAGRVRTAMRHGRTDGLGMQRGRQPVTIRGVVYPSFSAAGRALGVHANAVRAAYCNGTLHRVGTGRVGPEPMCVRIAGQDFSDVSAAAAHFGVAKMTVYAAIGDGDPDRIARKQIYNPWKAQTFEIGGLKFPSMREASRALGFANEEYIAKVLKRRSKRGRERILAAAMKYAAKAEVSG